MKLAFMTAIKERARSCLLHEVVKRAVLPAGGIVVLTVLQADPISWLRVGICLMILLLIPALGIAGLRAIARRRSNAANAATLGLLVTIDLLLGLMSVRWTISGGLSAAIVGAFALGGLLYAVWMMTLATNLEK